MASRIRRTPKYRHFRPRDLAVVRIDGHDHYLGKYGSEESWETYHQLILKWLQQGKSPSLDPAAGNNTPPSVLEMRINELILVYFQFAKSYYVKNDRPTDQIYGIRAALRFLRRLYGHSPAATFGPRHLKAVRQTMIEANLSRNYINANVDRIRRMFRWAASEELVPVTTYQALLTVTGLRAGRSAARETEPVGPVPLPIVEATLPFLTDQVTAMVKLQLATGARPGEVCGLRPTDIIFGTDGMWVYRPSSHKTEHEGKDRFIVLGPKAQAILGPFLERDPEAYCFSPAEAVEARNAKRRRERKSPVTPSQARRKPKVKPKRTAGIYYTPDSYRTAVTRACKKAGIPKWAPNRLRHTRATLVREEFGLEGSQAVLGHADPKVTARYAERNLKMAKDVMRHMG